MLAYHFFTGFIASIAYAMVFELRGRTLFSASIGGGLSWLIYQLVALIPRVNYLLPFLVSTLTVSLYSEFMARKMKKPATVYLIVAMLPLVPGQGIYDTLYAFVSGDSALGLQIGSRTLAITGTLTLGMLLASTVVRMILKNFPERSQRPQRL